MESDLWSIFLMACNSAPVQCSTWKSGKHVPPPKCGLETCLGSKRGCFFLNATDQIESWGRYGIDIPKCHRKHPFLKLGALSTNAPPSVCGGLWVVKNLQRGCFWTALTVLQYSSSPLSDLALVDLLRQHPCRALSPGCICKIFFSTFRKSESMKEIQQAMLGISLYFIRFLSLYILYIIRDTYLYIVMLGYIAIALLKMGSAGWPETASVVSSCALVTT